MTPKQRCSPSIGQSSVAPGCIIVLLNAGDSPEIRLFQNAGSPALIPYSDNWRWLRIERSAAVTKVGGDWMVNGNAEPCDTNPEFDNTGCETWWGVGCSNGPGFVAKFNPGILAPAGTCAGPSEGHTTGAFDICKDENFAAYSVFVRANREVSPRTPRFPHNNDYASFATAPRWRGPCSSADEASPRRRCLARAVLMPCSL